MKVIIAGSRDITDYEKLKEVISHSNFTITEVVCGEARGVDALGRRWAEENGIAIKSFPVTSYDWETYGRSAGHRRNRKMGDYADALIAIWDGESRGTKNMIDEMKKLNKPVSIYFYEKSNVLDFMVRSLG